MNKLVREVYAHRSLFGDGGGGNQPTEFRVQEIAERVIEEGHPYVTTSCVLGTPESGPYVLRQYGYRLGQLFVEMDAGGTVFLTSRSNKQRFGGGWWAITWPFGYRRGGAYWTRRIQDRLRALQKWVDNGGRTQMFDRHYYNYVKGG